MMKRRRKGRINWIFQKYSEDFKRTRDRPLDGPLIIKNGKALTGVVGRRKGVKETVAR